MPKPAPERVITGDPQDGDIQADTSLRPRRLEDLRPRSLMAFGSPIPSRVS